MSSELNNLVNFICGTVRTRIQNSINATVPADATYSGDVIPPTSIAPSQQYAVPVYNAGNNSYSIYFNGIIPDSAAVTAAGKHVLAGKFTGGLLGTTPATIPKVSPCPATYTGDNGIVYTDIRDDGTTCFTKNYGRGAGRIPDKKACTDWDSRFTDDGTSCWLTGYDRGAGTIPNACPSGYTNVGGVCYKYGGYWNYTWGAGSCNGPMQKPLCNRYGCGNCCGGYNDCYQTWIRTIDASQLPSCPADRPDKNAGLCYPNCRQGYYGAATMCLPSDQIVGIKKTAMDRYLCKPEEELWGAMCYPKCKPGFTNDACCICRPDKGYLGFKWLPERQYCDNGSLKIAGLCWSAPFNSPTGWYTKAGIFYSNDQIVPARGYSNIIYFGSSGSDPYILLPPFKLDVQALTTDTIFTQCGASKSSPFNLSIVQDTSSSSGYSLNIKTGAINLDIKKVYMKMNPIYFNLRFDMNVAGSLNINLPIVVNPSPEPSASTALLIVNTQNFKIYMYLPPNLNTSTNINKNIDMSSIPSTYLLIASLSATLIGLIPGTCGIGSLASAALCSYNIWKYANNRDPLYQRFNFTLGNIDPISDYIATKILKSIVTVDIPSIPAINSIFSALQLPQLKLTVSNIQEDGFLVGWNSDNATVKMLDKVSGYSSMTNFLTIAWGFITALIAIGTTAKAAGNLAFYGSLFAIGFTAPVAVFCAFSELMMSIFVGLVCKGVDEASLIQDRIKYIGYDESRNMTPFQSILSIVLPHILNSIGINRNMSSLFTAGIVPPPTPILR